MSSEQLDEGSSLEDQQDQCLILDFSAVSGFFIAEIIDTILTI